MAMDHVTSVFVMSQQVKRVECPICGKFWAKTHIAVHVNGCLNEQEAHGEDIETEISPSRVAKVRKLTSDDYETAQFNEIGCDTSKSARPAVRKAVSVISEKAPENVVKETVPPSSRDPWGCLSKSRTPPGDITKITTSPKIPTEPAGDTTIPAQDSAEPRAQIISNREQAPMFTKKTAPVAFFGNVFKRARAEHQEPPANSFKLQMACGPDSTGMGPPQKKTKLQPSRKNDLPLAEQMRPSRLGEYIGQDHIVGKNKMLHSLLLADQIPSMVLWGPPGCGKTTLARIIAQRCKESHDTRFVQLSATTSGIADVKEVIKVAKNEMRMFKRKTILFIDEIHRFNKLQQDSFLPHVEDGTVVLIGATTENPSFQVNNALLSRCRLFVLEKLTVDHIERILRRAIDTVGVTISGQVNERRCDLESVESESLPGKAARITMDAAALTTLAQLCDGDARVALNGLHMAVNSKASGLRQTGEPTEVTGSSTCPSRVISVQDIKDGLQRTHTQYDRAGEEHYNCASALQKSIRGSDENGAIYWLARMLEGGEDPLFIARRLVVTASEDIGLADSQALSIAVATFQACQFIGMPECAINLGHCTTYLARAPKSVASFQALKKARDCIRNTEGPLPGVPLHLRNASNRTMKQLGYGAGYKYNPACDGRVEQEYLPKELRGMDFFSNK